MTSWTAIVLAGTRPGVDPFAATYGTDLKPLIPVGGKPMVARPVAALLANPAVERVRVLTQKVRRIRDVLPSDPRLSVEESGPTIAATLESVLANPATRYPLLVTTADHALLDGAMLDDFFRKADGADVAIGLVERSNLVARLPQSKRTWLKFRGGAYSGANLFAFGDARAAKAVALWRSVEQDRKKGWKMIGSLGPSVLLGAAFRLKTLQQTLDDVGRKLGLSICAVELSNPLAAVDVDKASDHELVTAILEGRA